MTGNAFPSSAPSANPVFFRTYSRKGAQGRESWGEMVERNLKGLAAVGRLSEAETSLLRRMQLEQKAMPSGRWMWVGGTDWIENPVNFSGAYNCTSLNLTDWDSFGLMMDLAMMGCGTGAKIEPWHIRELPKIINKIEIDGVSDIGTIAKSERMDSTALLDIDGKTVLRVGDSRKGWVEAYTTILKLSSDSNWKGPIHLDIDLSHVRPPGEPLKGFGGTANPVKLRDFWGRIAAILNRAKGRQLTSVECCILIDESAVVVVAGNVRRSAGMRQFHERDVEASQAKDNLWQQDPEGGWRIDPERDALRMANHTRVFHQKPTREEVVDSVRKQFASGEGAIQYAPEAVARANADLLTTPALKQAFLDEYNSKQGGAVGAAIFIDKLTNHVMLADEVTHRVGRYGLNPCGEIIGNGFHCVSKNTPIIHKDGIDLIANIEGREVDVWNGSRWSTVIPIQTGSSRKLYRVSFSDGSHLDVTEGHRWFVQNRFQCKFTEVTTVELLELISSSRYGIYTEPFEISYEGGEDVKGAYTLGVLVGDGTTYKNGKKGYSSVVRLHGKKQDLPIEADNHTLSTADGRISTFCSGIDWDGMQLRLLKENAAALRSIGSWSRKSILEFVAGLADTDGADTACNGIRVYMSGYERAEAIYLLLLKCGIRSSINLMAKAGSVTNYGTRKSDLYYLQITDCSDIPCYRLDTSRGRKPAHKGKNQIVRSVVELPGLHDTFCFNEPEHHKAVFAGSLTGQCNLSEVHLNQLRPYDHPGITDAFRAAAISASALLHHRFEVHRFRQSREWDPIIGVSFTGLFDFFVEAFGVEWLRWFADGRPLTDQGQAFREGEKSYLTSWRQIVADTVSEYCAKHGLRRPNRYTTVQPAGTKSLLTGASPGWHPPKSQRFIRRITFRKGDPVALACMDYGYSIVPSQSDKDESGRLLDDPFDPRCTEWLVEIPTEVPWANLPGADEVDLSQIPAAAQFDFYMQVQTHWTTHNTSATIEYRENEIEPLADLIYEAIQGDKGYISAALLARFDANETFPRLPFEPIDQATFERLQAEVEARKRSDDFGESLRRHDAGELVEAGPAGCDSDKCLLPAQKPG